MLKLIHKERGYKPMMEDLQNGPVDAPAGDQPAEAPAAEPAPAPEAAPQEAAPAE